MFDKVKAQKKLRTYEERDKKKAYYRKRKKSITIFSIFPSERKGNLKMNMMACTFVRTLSTWSSGTSRQKRCMLIVSFGSTVITCSMCAKLNQRRKRKKKEGKKGRYLDII